MGEGTQESPLTREDVRSEIEENKGDARRLKLSDKWFETGINLQNLPLEGINLQNGIFPAYIEGSRSIGARFDGSSILGANLRNASLQDASFGMYGSKPTAMQGVDLRGAHLENANFQGANLTADQFRETEIAAPTKPWEFLKPQESLPAYLDNTDFRYAVLTLAQFKGCYFYGTKLEGAYIRGADIYEAHLEEVDWGSYVLGEENKKDFYSAVHYYRQLKIWYTNAGMYYEAGKFFYREQEVSRQYIQQELSQQLKKVKYLKRFHIILKSIFLKPRRGLNLAWFWIYRILCGYGEKPWHVVAWAASVIVISTLVYFTIGSIWEVWQSSTFWNSLYFSAVSFTALGYGSWVNLDNNLASDIIRGIGAFESFIGVFTIALFLITFTRKMTR